MSGGRAWTIRSDSLELWQDLVFQDMYIIPQTVLALRGSYFLSIVIASDSRIAGCQPTCLDLPSSAANSLDSTIAGCQPICLDLLRLA